MSVYAIVSAGSKQYWVEPNQTFQIEKIEIPEGEKGIILDKVLFYQLCQFSLRNLQLLRVYYHFLILF